MAAGRRIRMQAWLVTRSETSNTFTTWRTEVEACLRSRRHQAARSLVLDWDRKIESQIPQENVMHSSRELRFRSSLSLVLALFIPALMVAQSEGVAPSAVSSPSRSVKQRLEQLQQHAGQIPPASTDRKSTRL